MAQGRNSNRSVEDVRRDLEQERDQLATAADSLRESLGEATDVTGKLRSNLPIVAGGALAAGFLVAGGVGATARLLFRRGREGSTKARVGRFRVVDDD
jgi:ornithine cyclodeaminase/alanine dehydrogenase-like protein (mu-crystallin family)